MNLQQAQDTLAADAGRADLVFPTNAKIALRIQKLLEDPDCSIEQLSKLLSAEPFLLSRLLNIANSVAYNRSGRTMSDVRSAISLLGFNTLRPLVTAVLIRQMQGMSQAPAQRALAGRLWEHTAHVAALARVIAQRVTQQDPDAAFFAGIIHEVGGFYLISQGTRFPELLDNGLAWWRETGEARIGRAVGGVLGVPENIRDAQESLWHGYLSMPPQSLGDTLLLADQLSPLASPLSGIDEIAREAPPADLDLMIDDVMLSGILAASAEEVNSLIEALKG